MTKWWDVEGRVETLRELRVNQGLSFSICAKRLGTTRNACISKANRLGFGGGPPRQRARRKGASPSFKFKPARRQPVAKPTGLGKAYAIDPEPFVAGPALVIPIAERKSIETLEANHCRWPIGDPQRADFHFCGKQRVSGLPYCPHHHKRAYQPPMVRTRTPRPDTSTGMPVAVPAAVTDTKVKEMA